MIDADHLQRSFGTIEAVRDVSFRVDAGEVFGFLGPNGAGKTTTINMLCTLLKPTAGTATINGLDVVADPNGVRRSIGLVFQHNTLDEGLTAEQNLRFHAYAYGMPAEERDGQIERLLNLVELWERRKDNVKDFSGGMRRRLEIARGLLHQPKVLFLDEPTLGLDPQTRRRIWDYLTELRDRDDLTIFLTTHYMDEADSCDRVAVIDHGHIVALDTPDRLKAEVGGDLVTLTTRPNPNRRQKRSSGATGSPRPSRITLCGSRWQGVRHSSPNSFAPSPSRWRRLLSAAPPSTTCSYTSLAERSEKTRARPRHRPN